MIRSALIFGLGAWLLSACGNATTDAPCQGTETCQCYPNKTCNGTLTCLSNLCVNAGGAGAGAGGAGTAGAPPVSTAGGPSTASDAPASGSLLWLRADLGVTESGGLVTAWVDQSQHGFDAIMDDASREPERVTNVWNGLPVLRFDGAQSLYLKEPIEPTTFTVFVAGRNQNSVDHSVFLGPGGNTPNNQMRWEDDSDVLIVGLGNDLPATTFPFADTRTFHVLTARYDGSKLTMSRNGESVGSARFTTSGPWQIGQVGGWFSSDFMIGDLAEILVYDRALSDSDTGLTNSYLLSKYGMR